MANVTMLRTLLDRARRRGSSVQFEVQRMTPAGGWINFYTEFVDDDAATTFDQPPDPPSFGPETAYPEGRYRCIERRDGQIHAVIWTVESPAAEQWYQDQRAKERERSQIDELSVEEFCSQLSEFTALEDPELLELLEEKIDAEKADSAPASVDEYLLQGVVDGTIDTEDLERGRKAGVEMARIEADHDQLCYRCHSSKTVAACTVCGDLVCSTHRDQSPGACLECL